MFRLYVYYKGFYTATNTSEWIWPSIRIAKINPQIFITIVGSHDLHHHHHNDNHYHHQQRSLVPFQSVTGFSIQFLFWQSLISTTTKPCSISICVWFFYSTLIPTKRYFSSIQMKLVSLNSFEILVSSMSILLPIISLIFSCLYFGFLYFLSW